MEAFSILAPKSSFEGAGTDRGETDMEEVAIGIVACFAVGLWWACDDVLCFAECIRDFEIRGLDWDDACLYVLGTLPGGPRLASRRRDHYHDKRFSTLKGFRRWPPFPPLFVLTYLKER